MQFPPIPPEVKSIAHFLKVASEHEERNIVVAYWGRMYACQRAMELVPGKKSEELSKLLIVLMDWMEVTKKANISNEGINNQTTAHALIEEYALQLFAYGDAQDRTGNFNKNTIKAFYTAGILMDILQQFGELSEDIQSKRKYAKWKAAYIHNCLKVGDIPIPGAPDEHLDNVVHRADLDDDDNYKANEDASTDGSSPLGDMGAPSSTNSNVIISPQPPLSSTSRSSPIVPPIQQNIAPPLVPTATSSGYYTALPPEKIKKAQKYCKFAESALDYEDFKTAVDNLNKALHLIQTGEEL